MKNIIFGIVIGVAVAVTGYLGWSFYQLNLVVAQDHALLSQIIQIMQAGQKQQK